MTINWNAIRARIEIVGDCLGLPEAEIDSTCASEDGLLAFAARHGQSLDWLVVGDVRPMLRSRARRA